MQDPKDIVYTLPGATLRALLFGDEQLTGVRIQSKSPGDTAKVLVIDRDLGQFIATGDPDECLFHVELFERHAELWINFEWADSNARRARIKANADLHRSVYIRRQERINRIRPLLSESLSPRDKEQLATLVADSYAKGDLNEVFKMLKLIDLVAEFRDEDEKEQGQNTKGSQGQA